MIITDFRIPIHLSKGACPISSDANQILTHTCIRKEIIIKLNILFFRELIQFAQENDGVVREIAER